MFSPQKPAEIVAEDEDIHDNLPDGGSITVSEFRFYFAPRGLGPRTPVSFEHAGRSSRSMQNESESPLGSRIQTGTESGTQHVPRQAVRRSGLSVPEIT